ncbi:O-antigen ligase family protein [Terracidiphilus gabretensis]|uniref:O-antigen ligase family protein n=1 Tax=Terracidiphilus gabretensis TaxID=1577687 RepID=UPI00071B3137|nr:O-antigen ligase family protein [Terracidiphilus gabretensis]
MKQGGMTLPIAMTRSSAVCADACGLAICTGALFACRAAFALVSARWLNLGPEPGVTGGLVLSAVLAIAAMLAAMGNSSTPIARMVRVRPVLWVLFYLTFAGCSLLWGALASPASSAIYWVGLICDAGTVLLLVRAYGAERTAHSLMRGFIGGTCVLAAVAWMMPVASDLRLGDLEYFNTNQIGNLCALAMLMCALLASRSDGRWRIAMLFLGITLFRSLSKSTLIAYIAAQAYVLLRDKSMSLRRKQLLVATAVVMTVVFWGVLEAYVGSYASGNQAESLTGRTAIWAWTLDAGLSKPWFGNGFDAMWKVAPPFGGDLFEARHAENELLQQFFAYGVCGIALLIGVYGSLYRKIRRLRSPERISLMAFLVYVTVRGLTEAEPFDLLLPLWLITTLALLMHAGPKLDPQSASLPTPAVQAC